MQVDKLAGLAEENSKNRISPCKIRHGKSFGPQEAGGQTSHAAVVARGMGRPCVVGCTEIQVDYSRELFYAGDTVIRKGDWITIDGSTGEVMEGRTTIVIAHRPATIALADRVVLLDEGRVLATGTHEELLETNDRYREVLATADESPDDAEVSV